MKQYLTLMEIKNRYLIPFICAVLMVLMLSPTVWADKRLAVNVPIANIRSGPGTTYKVLWKVEKYHPFKVIQSSGEWYKFIDFEGDKGWIHSSLVSNIPTIIVKKNNCNVRSGPGTNYSILFRAEKGVPFKVLEQKQKWIRIQHADGDKGWIYNSLVW